jgi:hypothetical protein
VLAEGKGEARPNITFRPATRAGLCLGRQGFGAPIGAATERGIRNPDGLIAHTGFRDWFMSAESPVVTGDCSRGKEKGKTSG